MADDYTNYIKHEGLEIKPDLTPNEIDPGVPACRNIWSWGRSKLVKNNGEISDDPYYLLRIFIVTYNSPLSLHRNLESLAKCSIPEWKGLPFRVEITVINNFPNFMLDKKYCASVRVLDNVMRHAGSCGHLARDSNTALIHGFENLEAPTCEQVIIAHDDVDWHPDALFKLMQYHHQMGYTFFASDFGGSVMSFLPEAVRKIGIFDERYCNIGFYEADYFLRAVIYNKEKSSINDVIQGRVFNPVPDVFKHPEYLPDKAESRGYSSLYHNISREIFERKWNCHTDRWKENGLLPDNFPVHSLMETPVYYPYFEMHIEDLKAKGYIFTQKNKRHWYDPWSEAYSQTTKDPLSPRIFLKLGPPKFQLAHNWQWVDRDVDQPFREPGAPQGLYNWMISYGKYNSWSEPNWNSWKEETPKSSTPSTNEKET